MATHDVKKIEQAAAALMDGRKHPIDSSWKDWRELNTVAGLSNDMNKEGKGRTMASELHTASNSGRRTGYAIKDLEEGE